MARRSSRWTTPAASSVGATLKRPPGSSARSSASKISASSEVGRSWVKRPHMPASSIVAPMPDDAPTPTRAELVAAAASQGPLERATALGLLDLGAELLGSGDFVSAAHAYQRVSGFDDPAITAAAWLGLGEALYRLDHEAEALSAWEAVLRLPETPSTYTAWRNVAAAHVRAGDLRDAVKAYREAERRAPVADRPEIASRLGWLAKETGDSGAARRYFARSRGDGPAIPLAYLVLGATIITSFYALSTDGTQFALAIELDKQALAQGELYRLFSVTLVHANLVHLAVN